MHNEPIAPCPSCHGEGVLEGPRVCARCRGVGLLARVRGELVTPPQPDEQLVAELVESGVFLGAP